jgi:CheY-like chemotaxis protein
MSQLTSDLPLDIIVAEDEPITRRRLVGTLETMGHHVRAYSTGRQAWEAFDSRPARVIISDWQMPEMDGPEFCELVRAREKTDYTYFILVTGMETTDEEYQIASHAGTDDFLIKPLTTLNLWRRLRVARRILNFTREIGQLKDLIPICAYCRQVREDDHFWSNIEQYIQAHTSSRFSHGICPQCYAKVMRDFEREKAGLSPAVEE